MISHVTLATLEYAKIDQQPLVWQEHPCDDCKSLGPRGKGLAMFVVKDDVWLSVAGKTDILCIDCFEGRLGRRINVSDLYPCGNTDTLLLGVRLGEVK